MKTGGLYLKIEAAIPTQNWEQRKAAPSFKVCCHQLCTIHGILRLLLGNLKWLKDNAVRHPVFPGSGAILTFF